MRFLVVFLTILSVPALALMTNAAAQAAETQQQARAGAMEMRGLDLRMYSTEPTFGELRDPTFWVHAKRGRLEGELDVWSLEEARAIIYRDPEDDLRLEAQQGTFDQTNQVAVLSDGVRATSRDLVVELDDIEWNNEENVAWSDSPARVTSGSNRLTGASVAIYPRDDRIKLGRGSGDIQMAQEAGAGENRKETASDANQQFESIRVEWQGELVGNLSGTLQKITKGAHLIIVAKEPQNNLDIRAESVEFEYASPEDRMPARMHLEGDVVVTHQNGAVRADKVDLDFDTGEAMFTGNPRVENAQIRGAHVSYIQLNLHTQEYVMGGPGRVEEIQLTAPENESANSAERP